MTTKTQPKSVLTNCQIESGSASFLDAMAVGVPVLANDIDIAREILGDVGIFTEFEPGENFVASLNKAIDLSRDPLFRERLISRAKEFASLDFGKEMIDVYRTRITS